MTNGTDIRYRVHKNSYFEGLNYSWTDSTRNQIQSIGKINCSISEESIKELFDRFWFFHYYDTSDAAVLQRNVTTIENKTIQYTMYYLEKVGGDFGMHDLISLYKTEYRIDKKTGITSIENKFIRQIKGKYN